MFPSRHIARHLLRSLTDRPWGSLLTFLACTLAIVLLALTVYVMDLARTATLVPASASTMMVYLKGKPSDALISEIKQAVGGIRGVSQAVFVPRSEGLERMRTWLGPDNPLVADLDADVLPDAFAVTLQKEYLNQAEQIAGQLRGVPGVEEVRYNRGLMGRLAGSYQGIRTTGVLFAGMLTVTLALIIFLSMRLNVLVRTDELATLDMLGADSVFLFGPFILEAVLIGTAAGILGSLAARALIEYVRTHITFLAGIMGAFTTGEAATVVGFALICSLSGTLLAIRR